jgi:hypothetical protein
MLTRESRSQKMIFSPRPSFWLEQVLSAVGPAHPPRKCYYVIFSFFSLLFSFNVAVCCRPELSFRALSTNFRTVLGGSMSSFSIPGRG